MWLLGAMVCLLAAQWVQLSVSADIRWPHNALRHHWLMRISCHFLDCKALLVTSLIHVSGAIASVQTFTFAFNTCLCFVYEALSGVCYFLETLCITLICKSARTLLLHNQSFHNAEIGKERNLTTYTIETLNRLQKVALHPQDEPYRTFSFSLSIHITQQNTGI